MYDLKPEAPAEFRGDFGPIQTTVPGMDICELLPLQAKIADQMSLIRSIQTVDPNHNLHEILTGFTFDQKRPAFGSVVSRVRSPRDLPGYVSFVEVPKGTPNESAEDPSYLGSAYRPFRPMGEGLRNLELDRNITLERLGERTALLPRVKQPSRRQA